MAQITTSIDIHRPLDEVYDFVTTPQSWLSWHPSSVRISGATDHSLHKGEQVTEEFVVAGRSGSVTWVVVEREAPRVWVIAGVVEGAGGGDIAYALSECGEGTRFVRTFTYRMANPLLSFLDWLFIRRRIRAESVRAVERLKRVLEESGAV